MKCLIMAMLLMFQQAPLGSTQGGAASTPSPGLVTHVSFSNSYTSGNITSIVYPFPGANGAGTLSGNCLIVATAYSVATGSITTVTTADNTANSYSYAFTQPGFSDSRRNIQVAYVSSAAGAKSVTVTFNGGGTANNVVTDITEINNSSCATDGTGSGGGTTTTAISSSSITTSVGKDWVQEFALNDNVGYATGNPCFTAGSGFTLLSANCYAGTSSQYEIKASAGSITPAMTMSPSGSYGTVAVAFKAAAGGTAPSGMYLAHLLHSSQFQSSNFPSLTSVNVQFPSSGNCVAGQWEGGADDAPEAVSDGTNTYVVGSAIANGGSGSVAYFVANNATTSATLTDTLTLPNSTANASIRVLFLYDIVGAPTQCLDRYATGFGNNTTTATQAGPSITPEYNPNGMILSVESQASQTVTSVSPGLALTTNPTPDIPTSPLDENNGQVDYSTTSDSAQAFTWTFNTTGPGLWVNQSISLAGPSSTGPSAGSGAWSARIAWGGTHTTSGAPPTRAIGTVTAGDLGVCVASNNDSKDMYLTDNNGNTWQQAFQTRDASFTHRIAVFFAQHMTSGATTVTVSATDGSAFSAGGSDYCATYNPGGGSNLWLPDGAAYAMTIDSGSTTINTGNLTTLQAGDLVIAAVSTSGFTPTAGSGYTLHVSDGTQFDFEEDQIQSAAGSIGGSFSGTVGSNTWIGGIVAFRHR